MAYELCKFQIESGNYNKEEMKENLVLFKMIGKLTAEQVLELNNMMNDEKANEEIKE